ncbi:hypothetical protein [Alicyclobacillus macrosporangiidus]|uniref:Tubulin/FtsZ family, GTPase domain n=1 Tax=Alicyclobacillus macrosporangiidus TaxID=392015 RepID=A0A1I7L2A1_9BACL|nr:hypothetical protein [Alicyclobacillus macrosporangiidus]SFV03912.1 Tubulin/FtsZ family, GTPase domain [Alicyclobacillus macrosporangiidus]
MLKFGFIGFGQYGGRQVDVLLPLSEHYTGMAVNTAVNDLEGLTNVPDGFRLQLKGNSFGAGRTPELAYNAFLDNGPEFVATAQTVTKDCDFIWVVAGLGGGTGTGALQGFLQHGTELFEQPIGLIITIPRDDDGAVQKANAMGALKYIQDAINEKRIGAVLIVDNDRFFRQFAAENRPGDWRDHSNLLLAKTLHDLNTITIESGQSNFDRTDLLKILCSSGCLAIGSANLRDLDQDSVYQTIRNSIQKGFFSSGYRLEEAEYYALCFTLNEEGSKVRSSTYEQHFVTHLKSLFPNATDSFFGYYTNHKNHVLSVVSGLGLPERVFQFKDQIKVVESRQVKRLDLDVSDLPAFSSTTNPLLRRKAGASEDNPLLKRRTTLSAGTAQASRDNPLLRKR